MKPQLKEMLKNMSPEDRQQLKEYADSLKEIRKAMSEIIKSAKSKSMKEVGGNMMGKSLPIK
jgi:hypothetical protein